ncbi:rab3 GTPase-activating protein catalytic subunit-like [Styela clava]
MADSPSRSNSMEEDEEVFEITDFTNVSDWEKFIAQISEAISDWQLTCIEHVRPLKKNELTLGSWEQVSREIRFSNAVFMLTLYRLKQTGRNEDEEIYHEESETTLEDELCLPVYMDDMMSTNNDFPPRAHCLVRWYGFRSFLVLNLISSGSNAVDGLTSESKCNLLLSSACIVLSDSGCEVPIFIQIQQNWRKMFTGRCVGTGMQTEFEMIHLKKSPPQYQHLSGLLHIFKSKIGRTLSPVQISARFTYVLSNWGEKGAWPQEQVDPDIAAQTFDKFLFGCLDDPIGDLQLSAMWPAINEGLIVENDVHSDFKPISAPVWTIRLHYTDNPECLLSGYIKEMLKLRTCKESFGNLVTTAPKSQDAEQDISQALNKMTDPSHKVKQMVPLMPEFTSGLSKIVTSQRSMWSRRMQVSSYATLGPISQSMIELIMEYLLPEAPSNEGQGSSKGVSSENEKGTFVHELEHQIKSAPKDSLTYRLALCVTVINFCHGGVAAIAQVWHEFVQEMRYRFENGVLLSGITSGNPDLRCCLFHQKLQMLNCCIQHKINREKNQNSVIDDLPQEDEDSENLDKTENKDVDSSNETNMEKGEDSKIQDSSPEISSAQDLILSNEESPKQEDDSDKHKDPGQLPREDSTTSIGAESAPRSPGWQEEVSSIDDDEFFECDEGGSIPDPDEVDKTVEETTLQEQTNEDIASIEQNVNADDIEIDEVNLSGDNSRNNEFPEEKSDLQDNITEKEKPMDSERNITQMDTEEPESSRPENSADSIKDSIAKENTKPMGRSKRFGSARLLNVDAYLYIPVTQESAPLTEDALEEQTKIFSSLGDSAEGALLRRKMQSASLLSDMESFKAANPGCGLGDFVRWYSPRDYEEKTDANGVTIGALSERMQIPGNLWQTMWNSAKPIPARRQKRLFDDTKEGEKVLHFLSSLQPKDLAILLLPICYHEAICVLQSKSDSKVSSVPSLCNQILTQSSKLFQTHYKDKWEQMDDIWQKIQFSETLIERAMSLKHKFASVKDAETFVRKLVEHPEVSLEGAANGDIGKLVKQYFLDQSAASLPQYLQEDEPPQTRMPSLPPPSGREYILRSTAPRPSSQSRPLPHRLYAVQLKNEFRLAGAFSSDTVFF